MAKSDADVLGALIVEAARYGCTIPPDTDIAAAHTTLNARLVQLLEERGVYEGSIIEVVGNRYEIGRLHGNNARVLSVNYWQLDWRGRVGIRPSRRTAVQWLELLGYEPTA